MKFVPASHDTEILQDTSRAEAQAKGERRYKTMIMTPREQDIYCENPNAAASSDHPAYPDENYGGV